MNQTPNPFPNFDDDSTSSRLPTEWEEIQNFSPERQERIKAAKQQAGKLFFVLLTIGLILGVGVSVGVVKVLNELGLTQKPQPTLRN